MIDRACSVTVNSRLLDEKNNWKKVKYEPLIRNIVLMVSTHSWALEIPNPLDVELFFLGRPRNVEYIQLSNQVIVLVNAAPTLAVIQHA